MRKFGEIEGVVPGQFFTDRKALAQAGVHKPLQAGISGSANEGADSIVLSGGYEDDEDYGSEIIYTGAGGRDVSTGQQNADQELTRQNLALARSKADGLPVRVTRSAKHKSPHSPRHGYQYAGLYYVDDAWRETGKSGFQICRFRLVAYSTPLISQTLRDQPPAYGETQRKEMTIQRIVRDTVTAKKVKQMHQYQCQVCGIALVTATGLYAEAAHIKPLGKPHNGPDIESNLICLCPNHHVLFDNGGFTINDDFTLNGIAGRLHVIPQHNIALSFVAYHREHYSTQK
ncbi:YDG/SRA domain-containing protein [Serratia sp. NPDC078593]|uniref:YDG/SRA domain-containing protein n=1 Tax=unclassified Serratia (in: enterobacteria) TaxID=2647522 RepID=UPI0037D66A92